MFPQRSQITMMRGHDAFEVPPVVLNVRDSGPARKRTKPEPEREPEAELLHHLDAMGAALLRLFPAFAAKAVAFDAEVREMVQERQKMREAAAGTEFDQLTEQCRAALEKVQKLEGERDEIRMDRNRALPLANAAAQKLARLKREKPQDADFPTRAEVAAWQTALSKARAEADEAQRPVDDLLAALRAKTAEISIAKSELAALKEKRNAARRRLDPAYVPAEADEADSEAETLRTT